MNPEELDLFSFGSSFIGASSPIDMAEIDIFGLTSSDLFNDIFGVTLSSSKKQNPPLKGSCHSEPNRTPNKTPFKKIVRNSTSKSINTFFVRKDHRINSSQRKNNAPKGSQDEKFYRACKDKSLTINPYQIGFVPSGYWPDQKYSFGDIVDDFFRRKNHPNSRFSHKVYNALLLSEKVPSLRQFIGLSWASDTILRVESNVFGRLLGITSIAGGLYHRQGNFTSHGFIDATPEQIARELSPEYPIPTEKDDFRLLVHQNLIIVKGCSEKDLENCKWTQSQPCSSKLEKE